MQEKGKEDDKITVQGLITPVQVAIDQFPSQASSISLNGEHNTHVNPTGVGALAPVKLTPQEHITRPSDTGGTSDSNSNTDDINTTVLLKSNKSEVSKMVEKVSGSRPKRKGHRSLLCLAHRPRADALQKISETPSTSPESGKWIRSPDEQNTANQKSKKQGALHL